MKLVRNIGKEFLCGCKKQRTLSEKIQNHTNTISIIYLYNIT